MKIHYKEFGEGQPLIILHGLYGSSDNWQTHGKKLAKYFHVFLLDQRNHGKSEWSDEFSYEVMADDVYEFIQEKGLENVILVGHSMGGKTAIQLAQKYPDVLEKLIVVDMGIKSYPFPEDHVRRIEGLKSIDLSTLKSRREANQQLEKYEPSYMIRMFLLKNLYRKGKDEWGWHINIPVLGSHLGMIVEASPHKETMVDTLFIYGGNSDYVVEDDYEAIRGVFPLVRFHKVEGAGHWIHAEKPDEFLEEVLSFTLN